MAIETIAAELERDLLRLLLELSDDPHPRNALHAALDLLVKAVEAERGYLEIFASSDRSRVQWSISSGCSGEEEAEIKEVTSRGIVSAALASGATLHVPYAALDDRFSSLPSVRDQRLEAVICVPLRGMGTGVLYLEGRRGAGPFGPEAIHLAETVARHAWPNLRRVGPTSESVGEDPTRPYRQRLQLGGILGRSAALARVFAQIEPYAPLDVTLLLTGPSGTGKTQIARAIHENSPRRQGPFVELNCAAIPEGLIESELFGTMPSAFPGARRTAGKVEAAEGGTLFLDELGEIPVQAQSKLLQLLQSRQYYALASTKLTTANIRLIAATNADLMAMVAQRRFREDLLYRINVVNVRMPGLSERRDDIAVLVDELIPRIAAEHGLRAIPASEQFRVFMECESWPGNVRQLRGRLEGALIRAHAENAEQIEPGHLHEGPPSEERARTFQEATRLYQRELVRRELAASDWNVTATATRLDLTRSHIYNLIHQFKLKREE